MQASQRTKFACFSASTASSLQGKVQRFLDDNPDIENVQMAHAATGRASNPLYSASLLYKVETAA